MNILFDFRVYEFEKNRGIGRYIYSLVDHILKNFPEIKVSILLKFNNNDNLPEFHYRNSSVNYYFYYKLNDYNFNEKFDFYFFDDMLLSSKKIDSVNTFFDDIFPEKILKSSKKIIAIGYDLIPLILNYISSWDDDSRNKYFLLLETIYILDYIFTDSECTKNDFVKYLNIDENRITNIYGGFFYKFNNLNIPNYSFKSRKNNIVFIAGADIRKNIKGAITAFSIAYNSKKIPENSKLYICCQLDKNYSKLLYQDIKEANLTKKQIIITGFISDNELIELISNSKFTIFPSFYEGLGMPILESYACNTPCFASNVSSTKELVLEECSFDPYDENDIANSIINGFNNEQLCNESIKFGKYLIENKCNWDIASKKVVNKLYEINKPIEINTAVFGALPPEKTGLAPYNAKTFGKNSNFHVFSKINNFTNFNIANKFLKDNFNNNFIPINYYCKFLDKYEYKKRIFVLGNSYHNIEYLKYAVKESNKNNSYLYLHEASLLGLLYYYFDCSEETLYNYLRIYYPNIKYRYKLLNYLTINNIYGIRLVLGMTNINNIIVNNNRAKELIINEIKYTDFFDKIKIFTMFLPIEKLDSIKPTLNDEYIYIGSFGIPSQHKGTFTIIEAVDIIINKYKKKLKLVLAGYDVNNYINGLDKKLLENIISFDSPDSDTFFSIMSSINIAIQLRNNSFGESSGVISQLIGMNKKIITTSGFIEYSNINNIREVKKNISKDELVVEILNYLDENVTDNTEVVNYYSYDNLCNKLLGL